MGVVSTPDPLARQAAERPGAVAVVADGVPWSYSDLHARAAGLAAGLARVELRAGDLVGVLAANSAQSVALIHAAQRLALTLVPLNTRLTAAELAWQCRHLALRQVVADPAHAALARAAGVDSVLALEALVGAASPLWEGPGLAPDDAQALVFTSGTSGRPKAARLTWANQQASAWASAERLGAPPDERWLCVLPFFHVGGLAIVVRSCLYGSAVVLAPDARVETIAEVIRRDQVSLVSLVPTHVHRLLAYDPAALRPVRLVLVGGAAARPALLEQARAAGIRVAATYGLTEACSQVATALPEQVARKPGSVGQPLPGTEVRILAEDGREAEPGQPGEIVVRGPTVFAGYAHDPQATAAVLRAGWLHTGDLGWRDADGDLWLLQRRSDLIVSGGENVYPAEVEHVLEQHPAVVVACVVGLADAAWGQRVAALVQLRAPITPADLIGFCRDHLAGYKIPRTVLFTKALPLLANGKVDRSQVLDRLSRGLTDSTEGDG
jgi:O-succinylbenzoic acid--CoA ligase